ncbi:fatty-acyl-CoA synthase [Exophiala viscosa]|uniref:fatty-acyl-CoA synthase n=1 Tax=Exophiala viscosa TaxID=2486360 RepID=UPI00218F2555|nr:fatty-acyl-CoA synthase [Exophiala viscosa]
MRAIFRPRTARWPPPPSSVSRTWCRFLTKASLRGPSNPPLLEETVGENFARIVSAHGDRNAVISRHQNKRLTYSQLDLDSNALARGLQSLGVKKGDRVCVSLGNNLEFATITYALFKLGAILVPLNPAFTGAQIISALNHLSATHLVIGTETNLPYKSPRSNIPILEKIVPDLSSSALSSEAIPSLKHIVLVDNSTGRVDPGALRVTTPWSWVSQDADTSPPKPSSPLSNNEVVNIQFTSGTTSMPKAACLSHRSILNNGNQIGDRMLLSSEDVVVCPPPLFHCFGCILGYMATATHGSAIVFPTEAFDPLASLKAVQEEKATALYGVPTMFLAQLELIDDEVVSQSGFEYLRTGIAAGSSIPAELMRKLHRVLNLTQLTICYGMTETSPVSAMTTTDDPIEKRINTVGRLLPHVEAKVVDPFDHNRILEVGERGELAVSGYLVMKEYWGQPERTTEVMRADEQGKIWMHTGDEASIDEDGYVSITGRIKDLIIRGGENIHPLEVENCLFAHPKIAEVSVVGLPDEKYGEVVAAFVVRRHHLPKGEEPVTVEDVRSWVKEHMSHHLVPKYVFFVADYPKTASGKIQKFKLRETGVELLKQMAQQK